MMGWSGISEARFADGTYLGPVVGMLHRDGWIPEGDEQPSAEYEGWWGHFRFEVALPEPQCERLDSHEIFIFGTDGPTPHRGWPADPLRLYVVLARKERHVYHALVREDRTEAVE